jgi:hypothetical protein
MVAQTIRIVPPVWEAGRMRRMRWKSKHAEAQPRNFANHGSKTGDWAPRQGVEQGVKPRRMLLRVFGGDGGAMW